MHSNRVAVFIDGHHLYGASRQLGFDVDYRGLLEFFRKRGALIRAYYYSAMLETDEYSPLKPLTDWLAYNGYTLVTKAAKEYTDAEGRRRVKGNMDIEMTVDMLELAPRLDEIVLLGGNGDFVEVVRALKRKGVRVVTLSSIKTSPPFCADELRRVSDDFMELQEVSAEFRRIKEPMRAGSRQATPAEPFAADPTATLPAALLAPRRRAGASA